MIWLFHSANFFNGRSVMYRITVSFQIMIEERLSETAYHILVAIAMQQRSIQHILPHDSSVPKDCIATSCELLLDEESAEVG